MNKRIKKKKAKQAELQRQRELEQLAQNPEQWKKWGEQFEKKDSN